MNPKKLRSSEKRKLVFLIVLFIGLCICAFVSIVSGASDLGIIDTVQAILGAAPERDILIVREIRLPRLLTAVFGGARLGVAGCILQCVLRNPLASASTLGISQGAAFGAAFAIIVLGAGFQSGANLPTFDNPAVIAICAFIGSTTSALTILGLSKFRSVSPEAMILCGVGLSALFAGATAMLQYFADEISVASVVFWTFGDLGRTAWKETSIIAGIVLILASACMFQRWNLNALEYGDQTAHSLGIPVDSFRLCMLMLCSMAAAVIVSFVGIINFVGLVAPHIARKFVGSAYGYLLPASAMTGAALLTLSDVAARTIASPITLPIGAITSLLGAPIFLYLLASGGKFR